MKIVNLKGQWAIRSKYAAVETLNDDTNEMETKLFKKFLDSPIFIAKIKNDIVYFFEGDDKVLTEEEATKAKHFPKAFYDDSNWQRYEGFIGEAPIPEGYQIMLNCPKTTKKVPQESEEGVRDPQVGIQTR